MDDLALLQQADTMGGQQQGGMGGNDAEVYNYYKDMYNRYQGNPQAQNQIVSQFDEYRNPINMQKRRQQEEQQKNLMAIMSGQMPGQEQPQMGGQPQMVGGFGSYTGEQQVNPSVLGAQTGGMGGGDDLVIDTDVEDNSLGGRAGRLANVFTSIPRGAIDIAQGVPESQRVMGNMLGRNPLTDVVDLAGSTGTNFAAGIGFQPAIDMNKQMSQRYAAQKFMNRPQQPGMAMGGQGQGLGSLF